VGKPIAKTEFTEADFQLFRRRLAINLRQLKELTRTPGFGLGPASFGAELELYIVDSTGLPVSYNQAIKNNFHNEHLTLELNRYNLEYNLSPVAAKGCPFSSLQQQMQSALTNLNKIASNHHVGVIPIGILPTLNTQHLGKHAITDEARYHALAQVLRKKRGSDFHIHIRGEDELDMRWGDVSPEGASTSFQFHYRVNPGDFRDAFNAAQLITPLSVALAANSPIFLGKRLWHETRVALFKQSIDCRMEDLLSHQLPPRVYFGHGWVRQDVCELFSEGVYLFPPLIPQCKDPDINCQPPELYELCLHHGSIWAWNRPIYDPSNGGHLRIELRATPAGPTPSDMLATAACSVGLIEGLRPHINSILPGLPFQYAEHNFYRAARDGLNASLFWPNFDANCIEERPVIGILEEYLPLAETGLARLGVDQSDIMTYLGIVNDTLKTGQNGAIWQLNTLQRLEQKMDRHQALKKMLRHYHGNFLDGIPVSQWQ